MRVLNIIELASTSPLAADDRSCIWSLRRSLLGVSHALPAVVHSTPWLNPVAVQDLHSLLPEWTPARDALLLLLLLDDVTDIVVRTWVCLCLSSLPVARLSLLLPPLVSVLRYETVAGKPDTPYHAGTEHLLNHVQMDL
jgi:hypothetical protein